MLPNRLLAAVVVWSLQGAVPPRPAEVNPLKDIKHLQCTFTVYATGMWRPTDPQAEVKSPELMKLDIDQIDTDGGSGMLTGTGEPAFATALLAGTSLHFLERSTTGSLTVTTIFAPETPDARRFRAVQ